MSFNLVWNTCSLLSGLSDLDVFVLAASAFSLTLHLLILNLRLKVEVEVVTASAEAILKSIFNLTVRMLLKKCHLGSLVILLSQLDG